LGAVEERIGWFHGGEEGVSLIKKAIRERHDGGNLAIKEKGFKK